MAIQVSPECTAKPRILHITNPNEKAKCIDPGFMGFDTDAFQMKSIIRMMRPSHAVIKNVQNVQASSIGEKG